MWTTASQLHKAFCACISHCKFAYYHDEGKSWRSSLCSYACHVSNVCNNYFCHVVYLQVLLLVTVLSVAAVHIVNGLRGGAPSQACNTLTPQHNNNAAQTTPSPHVVDLSDFNVTEDDDTGEVTIYYYPDTMYESE